jgi:hypothetical protein
MPGELVRTNVYSGEHKVRQDLAAILAEHEYEVDSYAMVDKDGERTLTVKAKKNLELTQTNLNFNHDPDKHPDEV